ncbi:MAG: hypothetical protein G01um10143_519 [Parcubacteria group bacterium Gr01-1014_3]|nr:MAG: hypothetical protein G01um10143_519 [Parcubacteria group bacterium Gr01-1014_3]
MNKKLSWKLLIPAGAILWFFDGLVRLVGVIMILIGIIDLLRALKSKK